jgi:ABC-type Fe3+/spermidine/putrescine transport system ATPase subunit
LDSGFEGGSLFVPPQSVGASEVHFEIGKSLTIAIRPEYVQAWKIIPNDKTNIVPIYLKSANFLGDHYEYTVGFNGSHQTFVISSAERYEPGSNIYLEMKSQGISLWPA